MRKSIILSTAFIFLFSICNTIWAHEDQDQRDLHMDEGVPDDMRGIERNWLILLKNGDEIKIKGGWNNEPGSNHPGLNELIEDFRRYQSSGTIPPGNPRRYVAWVTSRERKQNAPDSKGEKGFIYIDISEIVAIRVTYYDDECCPQL